jgi:hypothetical protein
LEGSKAVAIENSFGMEPTNEFFESTILSTGGVIVAKAPGGVKGKSEMIGDEQGIEKPHVFRGFIQERG